MYRIILLSVFVAGSAMHAEAQNLYMPRNIEAAFQKGSRSMDGRPGKNYWQNKARYNITVSAAPPGRTIKGKEDITYINNSPDTLNYLAIKFILNIHKPGAVRNQNVSANYLTEGVTVDAFSVNGQSAVWRENPGLFTWQPVGLSKALLPHDSVKLTFDWHYQVSIESNREGMIDSTTFFLAYFYPRVAVYDDYDGWDVIDFTDQQEFYNDFNDYTLNVEVPANYIVWATGTLQNADEVLQPAFATRLGESMKTDEIIHVATREDLAKKNVTQQKAVNVWRWTAGHITDMALGLSDHFVWDASSVVVDPTTNRRASVQAAFNDTAKDFHQMVEFGRHSLSWFSKNWPGVPYPFPKTTIFQGYADMEYPMMVNDATTPNPEFSKFVAEHEIAHTWFPFYMGINESRYAFMDEGWATTFELLIGREDNGIEKAEDFYKRFRVNGWINDPSGEEDLPIITPANVLKNQAYGNNAYGKPSLAYLALKDMLGDDLFKKCLQGYMALWNGKHPIPWDFFNSFNTLSGKNLNWFWTNWFFTNYYIDLTVKNVVKTKTGYSVSLENKGGFAVPVDLEIVYEDGSKESIHKTPEIWREDQKKANVNLATAKKIKSVELKKTIFMDARENDNKWVAK